MNILARGANPDTEIPKLVRDGLKTDGYDTGTLKPTKVSEKDLKGAVKIVSFGPDLKPGSQMEQLRHTLRQRRLWESARIHAAAT